jgi:hypothetical protein
MFWMLLALYATKSAWTPSNVNGCLEARFSGF